jgi:hypothetical protein
MRQAQPYDLLRGQGNEGSTPALGDAQARRLLEAPAPDTLKGVGYAPMDF